MVIQDLEIFKSVAYTVSAIYPFAHFLKNSNLTGFYNRHKGFLFKRDKLCVPICSIRELLVRESHGGGFMGNFGVHKTLGILNQHFY